MTRIDLRLEKVKGVRHAVGAGFVALDIVEGRNSTFATAGGSCGNVLSILSWMGWHSHLTGRLGADVASEYIADELTELGVDIENLIFDESISTPIVIQKFVESKDGERTHRFSLTCPDCRGWLPRFRPMTLKQAAPLLESRVKPKTFYFDQVSPASLKLAKWANECGALVMFEPASVNDERAFQRAVDLCHIFKYSDERLGHLPDLEKTQHPKLIVKTLGASGLEMRWRNRWSSMSAFDAPKFEDAAGSGDWCSAGILHRLGVGGGAGLDDLSKPNLERGVRFGQALAAINCGFEGARGLMNFMDHDSLNRALQALASFKQVDDWGQDHDDHRSLPDKLCNLCAPPKTQRTKRKKLKKSA